MPFTGLKIVGTGTCLPWCRISSSFQNSLKTSGHQGYEFLEFWCWNLVPFLSDIGFQLRSHAVVIAAVCGFPTRMSNLDSSDHRALFHFETVHFKWALAHRTRRRFWTMFTYGFLFAWYIFSCHLQMARWIVFTDSGFWKYSWAHLVMSMTESCRWVMQCRLRARRPRASNKGLRPCPLCTEISPDSESFDDVMHCRWWDLQSLCNLMLRNVVIKVFHNLFTHSFTDWRASAHLYFWETLPLQDIPFIANHVTDLMSINLISC